MVRAAGTGATAAGTFLLGIPLTAISTGDNPPDGDGRIGFYIHVLENGDVAVGHAQPEIGQGLRTTLIMLVAEEMDLDWERIRIEPMPLGIVKTAEGYTWKYGGQGVGGSTGLTSNWTYMREVGATARLCPRITQFSSNKGLSKRSKASRPSR